MLQNKFHNRASDRDIRKLEPRLEPGYGYAEPELEWVYNLVQTALGSEKRRISTLRLVSLAWALGGSTGMYIAETVLCVFEAPR